MLGNPTDIGLYLHVPYCRALCHYCDFAKTANFSDETTAAFLKELTRQLGRWLEKPEVTTRLAASGGFASVFFGGGTPSLFTHEYAPLWELITPRLKEGAEVSLEANPDDISTERLRTWRAAGLTRLSIGVQTFDANGLRGLMRTHDTQGARAAIELALNEIKNLNIDLIYGWPGQTTAIWKQDLDQAITLGVPHLSLYNLTFEPRTPIGRAAARGKIQPQDDERLAEFYQIACDRLAKAGYQHEEVSNWAKPGFSCRHNWLYWQDRSYLGVGPGAHGYFADPHGVGLRYAYDRNDRTFIRLDGRIDVQVEDRSLDDWLTELVGSGLRTTAGIDLTAALKRTGRTWQPSPILQEGIERRIITIDQGRLRLAPPEWFREAGWAVEVLRSALKPSPKQSF